jgi:hypothetical protein
MPYKRKQKPLLGPVFQLQDRPFRNKTQKLNAMQTTTSKVEIHGQLSWKPKIKLVNANQAILGIFASLSRAFQIFNHNKLAHFTEKMSLKCWTERN